jgi:hypothetical protein
MVEGTGFDPGRDQIVQSRRVWRHVARVFQRFGPLQQGEQLVNKKSVNLLGEKSYIKYHQTPLLPAVKDRIQNPANQIESVANDGWVRGGIPSRELTRDTDYNNKHSTYQYT